MIGMIQEEKERDMYYYKRRDHTLAQHITVLEITATGDHVFGTKRAARFARF